jgi:hypothetical protein
LIKHKQKLCKSSAHNLYPSDITNFAGKFNNGQVDIIGAPAVAFRPLELYRGLGEKGAIFRFPLIQVTASVIVNRDKYKHIPDFDTRMIINASICRHQTGYD